MAEQRKTVLWSFLGDQEGSFLSLNADHTGRLYFPLMNEAGLRSSVTPELKGDISAGFDKYLMPPIVTEDLHRTNNSRYFWLRFGNRPAWSLNGLSPQQQLLKWSENPEESEIVARPGSFTLRRKHFELPVEAQITIFVPPGGKKVELWQVKVRNSGKEMLRFTPFLALPLFGRHADNLRDHRQVTTMFQKCSRSDSGVTIKPTIVHDESGHRVNKTSYFVFAYADENQKPDRIWTRMQDFIGEGGSMNNPGTVNKNLPEPELEPDQRNGVEAIAAFSFKEKELQPGEESVYMLVAGVTDEDDAEEIASSFSSKEKLSGALNKTHAYWSELINEVNFRTGKREFDEWTKWLAFQLKCRQIFGNSFLPDFGYGRGGRGWRDLWQDLLSIFLVDPESARDEIVNNLKGIRIDGSNATIIGDKPGEFKADRNNIPRTWCDHGAWPLFALNFYIQQSGDTGILFEEISYWKDQHINRSRAKDELWTADEGTWLKTKTGGIYQGTVLEHVLVQQLSAFFNVGSHNILKLEGADWNDTLDMARNKGESVCFQNFYAGNLATIIKLLETLKSEGKSKIYILKEISILLDRAIAKKITDYDSPEDKQRVLGQYFEKVGWRVSGNRKLIDAEDLIKDLKQKLYHSVSHIKAQEWLQTRGGYGYFNGHYDDLGCRMHGDFSEGPRMDLTSQVMPVMFDIADDDQIEKLYRSARSILGTGDSPGLRLCTEYPDIDMNIGRITGFVYGYKEHGSKWMQQNIMFMYGLLHRNKPGYAHQMFSDIFSISTNSSTAMTFPGIASFYDPEDRGAYMYLTGSSTWLFLSIVTQIFGVRGSMGNLLINPKLSDWFFDENNESNIEFTFQKKRVSIKYIKKSGVPAENSQITEIVADGKQIFSGNSREVIIDSSLVSSSKSEQFQIEVSLG